MEIDKPIPAQPAAEADIDYNQMLELFKQDFNKMCEALELVITEGNKTISDDKLLDQYDENLQDSIESLIGWQEFINAMD